MTIKALLNRGAENEKPLEKIADAFLYLPRKMWLGKNVHIVKIDDDRTVMQRQFNQTPTDKIGKLLKSDSYAPKGLGALLTPVYALASALLSIPLGIGLALKEIAIHTDKKAGLYSKAVNEQLKLEKVTDKINQIALVLGDEDLSFRQHTPEEKKLLEKQKQLERRPCLKAYIDEVGKN